MERKDNRHTDEQDIARQEILQSLLNESIERGMAYYRLEGSSAGGQVSFVGNDQKLHLCYVYASDSLSVYDWAQIGELSAQGEIPLVVDSKRVSREAIQALLPNYLKVNYPEMSTIVGDVVTDEEVGSGNEYVSEFDFQERAKLIERFTLSSKENGTIEVYYDTEFDIADHVDIYADISDQRSLPIVTLYGKNYVPELAREGIDPNLGNRHYVVDADFLTKNDVVKALPIYFREKWAPALDQLPVNVLELDKEPAVSDPVSGFKNGIFSSENWGDPTINYIREPLRLDYEVNEQNSLFYFGQEIKDVQLIHKQGNPTLGDFRAMEVRGLYGAGNVILGTSEEQRYALVHSNRADKWFYVSWYKHRSNTEAINYLEEDEGNFSLGDPITYDDAVFLGNFLNEIELKVPDRKIELKTLHTHEEFQL